MLVASPGNLSFTDPIWCFRDDCPSTVGRTVAIVRSSQSRGKPSSRNHGEDICHDPYHGKFVAITAGRQLPLTHRALTVPRYQILRVLNRLFLYSCSKPEHPPVGDHSCTTGNRSRNLCYDSWSLSHLGYLYPGTTPVMIKLDLTRSVSRWHEVCHDSLHTKKIKNKKYIYIYIYIYISLQWGKTLTHTFLRTFEFFSAATRARSKSHTTPNTEWVTKYGVGHDCLPKGQFNEVKPSQSHFWEPSSWLPAVTRVRSKSHTTPNTESVTILYKNDSWKVKPSHTNFWEPPILFSAVTRARSKSHTTPDTECVTILYKISVQWGQTLTHALLRTTEFVHGNYSGE